MRISVDWKGNYENMVIKVLVLETYLKYGIMDRGF